MKIDINEEDYLKCKEASENYWSNSKKGFFGRGIINTKNDPCKVPRIGLLGEMAFCRFLDIKAPNLDYLHNGDKEDFTVNGMSVDIKTAARNYGAALIRCESEKGRSVFKKYDVYVGAYLLYDNGTTAQVNLVGWLPLNEVILLDKKPARVGHHKNYELEFDKIHPIISIRECLGL